MPRTARASQGGYCYRVLNRGNVRRTVFHKEGDFNAFLKLLHQASQRVPVRLLGYCLRPNHFPLCLWPAADGQLSDYMMWLLTAHVRRYHRHYHSSGHVGQGRFKAFPIAQDLHLLTVLRYLERNPLRAKRVERVQDWRWSSAALIEPTEWMPRPCLAEGPVRKPEDWLAYVNEPQTEAELERLRECLRRGRPLGGRHWTAQTASALGLEATLRPLGRPKKQPPTSPGLFGAEAE